MRHGFTAAWADDGLLLVYTDDNIRRVFSTDDLEKRWLRTIDVRTGAVRDVAHGLRPTWSSDGTRVAFTERPPSSPDGAVDVVVYDVASATEIGRIPALLQPRTLAWRGHTLVYLRGDEVHAWTPSADAIVARLPLPAADVVQLTSDGAQAILASGFRDVMPTADWAIFDIPTGRLTALPGAWSVSPSPRGHRLVVAYEERTQIRDEDGSSVGVPRPFAGSVFWSADGRAPFSVEPWYVFGTQLPAARELLRLDGTPSGVTIPAASRGALSPDGAHYAQVYNDGWGTYEIRVFSCAPGRAETGPRPETVTLYYPESDERWAADPDGGAPPDWRRLAQGALVVAGLHPLTIERVASVPPLTGCDRCGNGFALAVAFPRDDVALALNRCFEPGDPPRYVPGGVGGYRCRPFAQRSDGRGLSPTR